MNELVANRPPPDLLHLLSAKWMSQLPRPESRTTRSKRGVDAGTGAHPETGEDIYTFLSTLAQRRAPGMDSVCFLGVRPCGTVQLIHSLFTLPSGPYDDGPPRLCAIVGAEFGKAHVVGLSPMTFAANDSFLGSAEEDFEAHVTGLTSTL